MNERSVDFNDNIEIRCITECHVTGSIVEDSSSKQKKITLTSDNNDNNEFVILGNPKYVNGIPYSKPEDIFYFNVPNTAIENDKVVFLTDPIINEGDPDNPQLSISPNGMTVNELIPNFASVYADIKIVENDSGVNGEIVPRVDLKFDLIPRRNVGNPTLESTTVKLYINDTYLTTTRSSTNSLNTQVDPTFGIDVRFLGDKRKVIQSAVDSAFVIKMLQTTEAPSIENFRLPLLHSGLIKFNYDDQWTLVQGKNLSEPVYVGWGVSEYTKDITFSYISDDSTPLLPNGVVAGIVTFEADIKNPGETTKFGYYLLPEPDSKPTEAKFKIKKEWIPELAKIMLNYNYSTPNKEFCFQLVSELSDTK